MKLEKFSGLAWVHRLYLINHASLASPQDAPVEQRLLEHLVDGFEGESGSLALFESEDSEHLRIIAGIGLPSGVLGSRVDARDGVMGYVIRENSPVLLCGDVSSDPRYAKYRLRNRGPVAGSAMCFPLTVQGRIIGALSVSRGAALARYEQENLDSGAIVVSLTSLVIENLRLQQEQRTRIAALLESEARFQAAQNQLLQSEKMASIGQLAAGVAHEINNPIGYVNSNLGALVNYLHVVFELLAAYEAAESALPAAMRAELGCLRQNADLEFLRTDIDSLVSESREGITRVTKIVKDLKDFSHLANEEEWQLADLHVGLESTLNIVRNELKYKCEIVKEYGVLPEIECLPSQLNQVFMNLLVNAGQAIEQRGTITIRTGTAGEEVWVEIEDTGKGIAPEHIGKIFDPFFTTKPLGKGTGLGLSLSYGIVQKHGGRVEVSSTSGQGSRFRVRLPQRHAALAALAAAQAREA